MAPPSDAATPPLLVRVLILDAARSVSVVSARGRAEISRASRLPARFTSGEGGSIRVNGKRYRGTVVVQKSSRAGRIRVLNELDLESYLKGVVPSEMPSDWPLEALKAQAVAARTYALWRSGEAGGGRGGWLAATVSDQVYGGLSGERASTNEAVDATRGEFLVFSGAIVPSYFHSTCGGISEQPSHVWKSLAARMGPSWHEADTRIFSAVECSECAASPHRDWSLEIPRGSFASAISRLTGFRLIDEIRVEERHSSGRVSWFGAKGRDRGGVYRSVRIDGQELRMAVGPSRVRSLLCEVTIQGDRVVFVGSGWGHGVGLCQWGARGMTERGFGYRQVLHRYYPGAVLERTGESE